MTWPVVKLGDLVTVKGGGTPDKSVPGFWNGDVPWASVKDFKSHELSVTVDSITEAGVKASTTQIIPAGNIIVATRMAVGKVAINTVDMAINQDLKAIFVGPMIDRKYLLHALVSNSGPLLAQATGATVKGIKVDVLKSLEIPLPPLEEQKRIAGILDQADALRRLRVRVLEKLNTLGQAVFQEMFGGLSFDTKLSSITVKITDGTHAAPEWSQTQEVPFLFVSSIKGQNIDFNTGKFVTENEYASLMRRTDLSSGDILYTCVGSYGNTAIVPKSAKFVFQRHIAHIKPKPDLLTSEYLSFALESPSARAQADKTVTGIAQKTMTLKALRELKIPLAPIDLQQEFSCRITQIKEQTKKIENVLQHEGALFSSLQSAAFQGKL